MSVLVSPTSGILDVTDRRLTLHQLALGWQRWMLSRNTPETTMASYGNGLGKFLTFADRHGVQDPAAVTVLLLEGFFLRLREQGASPGTVAHRRSVLKSFWAWLEHEGFADRNIPGKTYPIKTPKRVPVWLEPHRIDEFLRGLAALTSPIGRRDFAIVATFFYSGLRVSELVALRLEDVDGKGARIRVLEGKGLKGRILYMVPKLQDVLRTYLADVRPTLMAQPRPGYLSQPLARIRPGHGRAGRSYRLRHWYATVTIDGKKMHRSTGTTDEREARAFLADMVRDLRLTQESPFLFPRAAARGGWVHAKAGQPLLTRSIYEVIHDRARELLGVELSPHKLRHTFASYGLYHGAQLETIQRMLGHADIRTTMIYLHVPQQRQEEELARIFGRE